jgi:hypothetical protein
MKRFNARRALNSWNAGMYEDSARSTSGTRWGRGLALMVPSTMITCAAAYALSSGAMAASFNVADQPLLTTIETVDGTGVAAVVSAVSAKSADGSIRQVPTLHVAISRGTLKGVCIIAPQKVAGMTYSIVIRAAETGIGTGQNIVLDATEAKGFNVNARDLMVGRSADEISLNGRSLGGQPGGLGIDGPNAVVHMENVVGTAFSAELLGAIQASDFSATIKPGVVTSC